MPQSRFGQKLCDEVARLLKKASLQFQEGVAEAAVHEVRKCLKRVRALGRLLQPFAAERVSQLETGAKEVHQQLASHREVAVLIHLLQEFLPAEAALGIAQQLSIPQLSDGATGASPDVPALQQRLADLRETWEASPSLSVGWREVAPEVQRLYRRGQRQLQAGPDSLRAWHSLRKSAKRLQYVIDYLTPWASQRLDGEYRQIDALTEVLGNLHDIHELRARLEAYQSDPPGQVPPELHAQLERRAQGLTQQARKLAAVVYAEPPKAYLGRLDCYRRARHRRT